MAANTTLIHRTTSPHTSPRRSAMLNESSGGSPFSPYAMGEITNTKKKNTSSQLSDPSIVLRVMLHEQQRMHQEVIQENATLRAQLRAAHFQRQQQQQGHGEKVAALSSSSAVMKRRGDRSLSSSHPLRSASCCVDGCHRNRTPPPFPPSRLRPPVSLNTMHATSSSSRRVQTSPVRVSSPVSSTTAAGTPLPPTHLASPLPSTEGHSRGSRSGCWGGMEESSAASATAAATAGRVLPPGGTTATTTATANSCGDRSNHSLTFDMQTQTTTSAATISSNSDTDDHHPGNVGLAAVASSLSQSHLHIQARPTMVSCRGVPHNAATQTDAAVTAFPSLVHVKESTAVTMLLRDLLLMLVSDDVPMGARTEAAAMQMASTTVMDSPLLQQVKQHIARLKRRVTASVRQAAEMEHMVSQFQIGQLTATRATHASLMHELGETLFSTTAAAADDCSINNNATKPSSRGGGGHRLAGSLVGSQSSSSTILPRHVDAVGRLVVPQAAAGTVSAFTAATSQSQHQDRNMNPMHIGGEMSSSGPPIPSEISPDVPTSTARYPRRQRPTSGIQVGGPRTSNDPLSVDSLVRSSSTAAVTSSHRHRHHHLNHVADGGDDDTVQREADESDGGDDNDHGAAHPHAPLAVSTMLGTSSTSLVNMTDDGTKGGAYAALLQQLQSPTSTVSRSLRPMSASGQRRRGGVGGAESSWSVNSSSTFSTLLDDNDVARYAAWKRDFLERLKAEEAEITEQLHETS